MARPLRFTSLPSPPSPKPLRLHTATHAPPPQEPTTSISYHYVALLRHSAATSDSHVTSSLHAHLLKLGLLSSSQFLHNHLLSAYFRSRRHHFGLRLLDEMPHRNAVSWSASIAGLAQCDQPHEALRVFRRMCRAGVTPNEFALVSALNASSFVDGIGRARQLYAHVVRLGFESNVFLMNAFLTAMVRGGRLVDAVELFDKSPVRDIVSWNSLLAGFTQLSCAQVWGLWRRMVREGVSPDGFSFSSVLSGLAASASMRSGVQVHAQLVKSGFGDEVCVGNSLVEMYMKNKDLDAGSKAFGDMPRRDVVSWTEKVAGCLHCGEAAKALEVVTDMKLAEIRPNNFTLATVINSCANLAGLDAGKKAHGYAIKVGGDLNVCVDNALIDMYAKCGSADCAYKAFQLMKQRPTISWTTMIMGFAQNGLAKEAMEVFEDMLLEGIAPNHVTFICVLYACSQGGFVDEGWIYFNSMASKFGIEPGEDHYACMVDLLGKAGRVEEAEELISRMPFRPGVLVWQTLLGACQLHGYEAVGERAAKHALALEKEDRSTYVLLSNMFADRHNWDGVGRVRELMEDRQVMKLPGCSWFQAIPGRNQALMV